ncbi:MAG: hypothetical protein U5J63_09975 [Fodinibius sp.]|nr:hypothetical protein [Fodinibius sp.]
MKRYQKILLGLFVLVLLVMGGIQIYFTYFLDDRLRSTLTDRFHAATDEQYELSIGDLDLAILGRELNISDISITRKKVELKPMISAKVQQLSISGISFTKLILNRELKLKKIELVNPSIDLTTEPAPEAENLLATMLSLQQLSRKFSAVVLQVLNNVTIPNLQLRGFSATYNRSDLPLNPYLAFDNSDIHLSNIVTHSASVADKRIVPAEEISATFNDIRYHTANQLYRLSVQQAALSSSDKSADIRSLQLTPRFQQKGTFAFRLAP